MLAPGVFGNWRGDADTEAISRIVCTHVFVHYTASSEDLQLRMKAWIERLELHLNWDFSRSGKPDPGFSRSWKFHQGGRLKTI